MAALAASTHSQSPASDRDLHHESEQLANPLLTPVSEEPPYNNQYQGHDTPPWRLRRVNKLVLLRQRLSMEIDAPEQDIHAA